METAPIEDVYEVAGDHRQNDAQIVAIENKPKDILRDTLSEHSLLPAPGRQSLEEETKQGNGDEPEIIL